MMKNNDQTTPLEIPADYKERLDAFKAAVQRGTRYLPDEESPPVDEQLLKRYLDKSATQEERALVNKLLLDFRPWVEAVSRLEMS